MTNEQASADLIMRLYELRREAKMREARSWVISFFPASFDDVMKAVIDEKTSAYFRMITTYWDMAAGFVNRGAIDEQMFLDSANEAWVVFSKIQPFLEQYREQSAMPNYLKQLESLLMRQPDAAATLEIRRETMKRWMAARGEMQDAARLDSQRR
jgi:hypothetical protein